MARLVLTAAEQVALLKAIQQKLAVSQTRIAALCRVHPRTFSDWMRGKSRMRHEAFQELITRTRFSAGSEIGRVPEFSHVKVAARLGALRRNVLYGNPGTPDGRQRGGLASIERRRTDAQQGVPVGGFRLAKSIQQPNRSPKLAEFMGTMLGDGCLNSAFQASLYFNTETDEPYAKFLETLALELFGVTPRRTVEPKSKAGALIFSSKRLVDSLIQLGFLRGDKVTHQAGVPTWITKHSSYRRSCLRGLMDTDGSVYCYRHTVYQQSYVHIALCFTNRSHPLLRFVKETLELDGYRPTATGFHVSLYRWADVERYFSDVSTHNDKHRHRFEAYRQEFAGRLRRGTQVVDGAALEKR